jgi:hypothetical protein
MQFEMFYASLMLYSVSFADNCILFIIIHSFIQKQTF